MKYKECPECGEAVDIGSHWDCVFVMMADWVKSRGPVDEVVHTEGVTERDEEKNG